MTERQRPVLMLVLALMMWLGVIYPAISSLIPVGSMLIANRMNSGALALDRFRSELESHVGQIEAALALGANARDTVTPYAQAAVRAFSPAQQLVVRPGVGEEG